MCLPPSCSSRFALSVFHPFGVLHRALPASSASLSLPLAFSLSLALRVCSHARKIELCGSWRPASHHIRSTPPSFIRDSAPLLLVDLLFYPHPRGSRDIQLSYISNDLQRALYPEFNSAQPAPTFSLPPLSPSPILLIGGPRDGPSITLEAEGRGCRCVGIFLVVLQGGFLFTWPVFETRYLYIPPVFFLRIYMIGHVMDMWNISLIIQCLSLNFQ